MTTYSRADWGARPAKSGPGPLDPAQVEGVALHWPAMASALGSVPAVMAALRSWQAYHMDTKGWSDIAYQVAVDQAGNRYDLRGLHTQSGANGDSDVNERFGAVLLVLAAGEEPTGAMVAETAAVIDDHERLFPRSRRVVGHSQIRPGGTTCPGPAVMSLIETGAFTRPSEEDDMQLSDKLYPKQADSPTVGDALKAVVRLEKAERRREELIKSRLAALRAAVAANASPAEVEALLNSLDAQITLVVNQEKQEP